HRDLVGFNAYPAFRYLHMTALDRAATMMTLLPRVGRLLVFPTQLSGDYSPTDVAIARGGELLLLPGFFMCLGVVLLAVALRRRSPVASFGLCWMILAYLPVSNLLAPTGFLIAERTLFFPSVGVVLVAGAIVARVLADGLPRPRWMAGGVVAALLVLGLAGSISRQRVWKNNRVFFDALVQDAPNSYRAHFLRARVVRGENRVPEMIAEYRHAMRLFPYDAKMTLAMAADYHDAGACSLASAIFRWSYVLEPTAAEGRYGYVECLMRERRWAEARTEALSAMAVMSGRDIRPLRVAVARADSALARRSP
ncbi:MAG TPA: hypothetical protein VFN38_17920, partial [Gemmatimonadaceae bacterium]|nr:hypothetical protein [Gemmatimonadaceae bacterium]